MANLVNFNAQEIVQLAKIFDGKVRMKSMNQIIDNIWMIAHENYIINIYE
jgi:hypothetical protein